MKILVYHVIDDDCVILYEYSVEAEIVMDSWIDTDDPECTLRETMELAGFVELPQVEKDGWR